MKSSKIKSNEAMNSKIVIATLVLVLVIGSFVGTAAAQEYSFGGDLAVVSKYIWRGQRLTNDWSMQPSMTMAIDGFSFNVWGTMDLMAVNEGTGRLLINENPATTGSGNNGLQGDFLRSTTRLRMTIRLMMSRSAAA